MHVEQAVAIGFEQADHDGQAARPVGGKERLEVAVDRGQREVVTGQRAEQALAGAGVGPHDVDGQREDRRVAAPQRGRDAGHRRRARPGVGKHLDAGSAGVAQIEPLARADGDEDRGEALTQEREVALQQGMAVEHEEALVDAGRRPLPPASSTPIVTGLSVRTLISPGKSSSGAQAG